MIFYLLEKRAKSGVAMHLCRRKLLCLWRQILRAQGKLGSPTLQGAA
jgi:hypothetical protein